MSVSFQDGNCVFNIICNLDLITLFSLYSSMILHFNKFIWEKPKSSAVSKKIKT
jgi:hypothetical protein